MKKRYRVLAVVKRAVRAIVNLLPDAEEDDPYYLALRLREEAAKRVRAQREWN